MQTKSDEKMKAPDAPTRSLYKCPRCKKEFESAHFSLARRSAGTISHCGTPSCWLKNIPQSEVSQRWVDTSDGPRQQWEIDREIEFENREARKLE